LTMMSRKPPSYCSYILRCWEEQTSADGIEMSSIRFSLEDPHTGERFGFQGPEALVQFLQAKVEGSNSDIADLPGRADPGK